MTDHIKSKQFFSEAKQLMPGGVNSPVRAFKAVKMDPLFIDHAIGDKIIDVDENVYIDYVCSWGPAILGHAYKDVIEAVKSACDKGLTFGAPTYKESILAHLIIDSIPCIEKVRLVNSGTEAVMSAVRLARGYTGRDLVLKFAGCYHGHSDGLLVKSGSGLLTNSVPDSEGIPSAYSDCTLVCEYNDLEAVSSIFKIKGERIACIVVEPVAANMGVVPPAPGFLEGLRNICNEYGALLIFDEVITGYRLAYGGASVYYNVKPDIVTLGKIVGGGMPLAAYGAKEEIMKKISPDGGVYQAGTLSGNPIAVTAGIETLKILKNQKDIYEILNSKARIIEEALKTIPKTCVNRAGSLLSIFFTEHPVANHNDAVLSDTDRYSAYFKYMLSNNIYIAPSQFEAMFISLAHSESDIEFTCNVIKSFDK